MCLPLAAVGAAGAMGGMGSIMGVMQIGLGVMGAITQHQGQMAQYNEQVRHRMEQAKQAQETLNQQVAQQQAALNSEVGKAQGEMQETAIKAYAAKSRIEASRTNVSGLSFGNLIADVYGEKGRFDNRVRYNTEVATHNASNELKMAERGGQARLASIPIPTKPSFAPTMVQIGSSVLQGIGTMNKYSSGSYGGSVYQAQGHHVMPA